MASINQTILIVEDDKDLNLQYQLFCQLAITSLHDIDIASINIKSAYNFEQAKKIIDQERVDFISIDLALQGSETDLSDKDRSMGLEPGGMQLLKHLRTKPILPIAIVVSGESLLSYAKDALQKYNVFAYYQKSSSSLTEEYQHALKAAVFYVNAYNLVSDIEAFKTSVDLIKSANSYWESAVQEAISANTSERNFPVDIGAKIKSLEKEIDAETKIPCHSWTEHALRRLLKEEGWELIQAQIYNFSAFAESQQSQVGPLLFFISNLLKNNLVKFGLRIDYIGLWRNEVSGPCVIVATKTQKEMNFDSMFSAIQLEFKNFAKQFTHNPSLMVPDSASQGVVPEMRINHWNNGAFSDWHELVDKLGNCTF
jgi:CheY-like chemotaxis protein